MEIAVLRPPSRRRHFDRARSIVVSTGLGCVIAGCASPGPPLPPSLKLPEVVNDLSAQRSGNTVTLRWTTPQHTTDGLNLPGSVLAEVCRESSVPTTLLPAAVPVPKVGHIQAQPCASIARLPVYPGSSQVTDALASTLVQTTPALLIYRVRLFNTAGKTAGLSGPAFASSGAAPPAVAGLRASDSKAGAVLEWQRVDPGQTVPGATAIELDRTLLQAATKFAEPGEAHQPAQSLAIHKVSTAQAGDARLRVGGTAAGGPVGGPASDSGGTLDRTAAVGNAYSYVARRIETIHLGTQTLEIQSDPSAPVSVMMRDVFPPERPTGLVSAPGLDTSGAAPMPTVDLSWEPAAEPRVAGYRIYRQALVAGVAAGPFNRLNETLVQAPAYRDLRVVAGSSYRYQVTAVDAQGNESRPSQSVDETATLP